MAHRIAWLHVTGEWPKDLVDHRDGDGLNNRWRNLRCATYKINNENHRRPKSNNKSGFLGVVAQGEKFYAYIKIGDKVKNLGGFSTAEEAHIIYVAAKRKHHEGCTI